ncbi:hypothetical protein [Mesorhizobium shangrilense]|uniref:Uncharacterized protein n=1 Tax=Mesorhizobium shangrilense TaxID=460060 RepID=A0ABV2DQI9_9HYPH
MIKALGDEFHESAAALGVVNPNIILEIFVSKKGTWTILATDTAGQSCVISAGEGWDSAMTAAAMPGPEPANLSRNVSVRTGACFQIGTSPYRIQEYENALPDDRPETRRSDVMKTSNPAWSVPAH